MKGQTGAVIAIVVFIAFLGFIISQIAITHPEAGSAFGSQDLTLLIAGFGGTAIACAAVGGIGCILSAGAFAILPAVVSENPVLFALIILPINVALGYIIARLARGGG